MTSLVFKEKSDIVKFEPKTNNRFLCEFRDSTGIFIPSFSIYSIDRPKVELNIDESGNRNYKWLPINVECYDPINPSTAQHICSHLERGESFNIVIKILGPVGDIIEQWEIVNVNIKLVDFGNLDWKCDSHTKIKLVVNYEYARLIF